MSLQNIDHFVVLMLENRSFDHFFGLRPGVDGILDNHKKSKFSNKDPQGGKVAAAGNAPFSIPTKHGLGPFHNLTDVNEQLFGTKSPGAGAAPTMSGFVASYREALNSDTHGNFIDNDLAVVMHCFDPAALPTISSLAENFVLCDAWFSEVPGPTHPNRLYMHAGTSQGFVHNVFQRPFDLLTIYELLQRNHKTWAVYDFDSSTLHAESNDQHAPHDVRWGEQFIADVYEALRSNDAVWNASAFIVTYDEHGGFFDHVAPPKAVSPDGINSPRPDDNFHNHPPPPFAFDRLGVRVPAVIASPWVGKGVVAHEQFQHTSILRTVRERFGIAQPLTKREAAARSLAQIFDQAAARKNVPAKLPRPKMPVLPPPDHHANPGNQFPDELQRDMMEGVIRATRASHPEDDTAPPRMPHTQARLSELAHRRWSRHDQFLNAQR